MTETGSSPQHVAIIMDGNGRWAKSQGWLRMLGHKQGAEVLKRTLRDAHDFGIKYLTVYAFSSENWARDEEEIAGLMALIRYYLKNELKTVQEKGIRLRFIGEHSKFPQDVRDLIHEAQTQTAMNTQFHFTVAFGYGARDEITRAVQAIVDAGVSSNQITEDTISQFLDTKDLPDPDLLIRTSGEQRLSNFLLWQLAYTEFLFLDVLWPDFTREHLEAACQFYQGRSRRYGAAS